MEGALWLTDSAEAVSGIWAGDIGGTAPLSSGMGSCCCDS